MDWEKQYWDLFDQYSKLWQYVAHLAMTNCGFLPPEHVKGNLTRRVTPENV